MPVHTRRFPARIIFNDIEEVHIERLKKASMRWPAAGRAANLNLVPNHLVSHWKNILPRMQAPGSANLVFMDQFGIKEVTPEVVSKLAKCSRTDILFFISSSMMNRFIETPEIGSKFDISRRKCLAAYVEFAANFLGFYKSIHQ